MAILWALLCGFAFGCGDTLTRLAVRTGTPFAGAVIISVTTTLFLSLPALAKGVDTGQLWPGTGWFFLMGVAALGPGRILFYFSVRRIGVSRASVMVSTTPLIVMLIAVVFLGERPSGLLIVGAFFVVGGVLSLVTDRSGIRITPMAALLGLFPTLFFSLSPIFIRLGMRSLAEPIFGSSVSAAGALVFVLATQNLIPREDRWGTDRRGFWLFFAGGLCYGIAFFTYYAALGIETASFVAPLVYTSPLFAMLFSRLLFQELERVTWPLAAGGAAIFIGVVLVSLSRGG